MLLHEVEGATMIRYKRGENHGKPTSFSGTVALFEVVMGLVSATHPQLWELDSSRGSPPQSSEGAGRLGLRTGGKRVGVCVCHCDKQNAMPGVDMCMTQCRSFFSLAPSILFSALSQHKLKTPYPGRGWQWRDPPL